MNRSSRFLFQHCFTGAEAALHNSNQKSAGHSSKKPRPTAFLRFSVFHDHFNAFFFQHLHDPCHVLAAHTFFVFRAESHMDGLHAFLFLRSTFSFMPSSSSGSFPQPLQLHKGCYFHIHSFVSFKTSDPLIERGKTGCPRTDFIGIEAI